MKTIDYKGVFHKVESGKFEMIAKIGNAIRTYSPDGALEIDLSLRVDPTTEEKEFSSIRCNAEGVHLVDSWVGEHVNLNILSFEIVYEIYNEVADFIAGEQE